MKDLESSLKAMMDNINVMKASQMILAGALSAVPTQSKALEDIDALHKEYWELGSLVQSTEEDHPGTKYPNPMFLTPDDRFILNPGVNPLHGFHLATAYAPLDVQSSAQPEFDRVGEEDQQQVVICTALTEFGRWVWSFRRRLTNITMRFFTGDAIAFVHTLQHARATGSSTAHFYRDRSLLEPLVLQSDYCAPASAPVAFDVIDTARLCGHVGSLNLLTACTPLLRNKLSAALYTETRTINRRSRKQILSHMLCGEVATVSTLLGLIAVQYWTGTDSVSHGDESLNELKIPSPQNTTGQGPLFLRICWKRPICPTPSDGVSLMSIQFEERELASVLCQVYINMFHWADVATSSAKSLLELQKDLMPLHQRASFAAFLRLVKTRVTCDWNSTMETLRKLIFAPSNPVVHKSCALELFVYLQLLDVYTIGTLNNHYYLAGKHDGTGHEMNDESSIGSIFQGSAIEGIRQWKDIPAIVCVTLRVPRQKLDDLNNIDPRRLGTLTVNCRLQSIPDSRQEQWENIYTACQIVFGAISCSGTRHSNDFAVQVAVDDDGWMGSCALLATFFVPSYLLLRMPLATMVSFGVHSTPASKLLFAGILNPSLNVYSTPLSRSDDVYITKYGPNLKDTLKVVGFTPDQVAASDAVNQGVTTSLKASVDVKTGCLASLTARIDLMSDKYSSVRTDEFQVTISNQSPCHTMVTLGERPPISVFFPTPAVSFVQKTTGAQTPSNIEIVAQLATLDDVADFSDSFIYPLFLAGVEKKAPLAWNMSHINLDTHPPLDISRTKKLPWLRAHIFKMFSSREHALRQNSNMIRSSGEQLRMDFKESISFLFKVFAGLKTNQHAVFGICGSPDADAEIIVLASKLRIDLATRTVVLDCAIANSAFLVKFINVTGDYIRIVVKEKTLSLWKQVLPAWAERCRTSWSHGDECKYKNLAGTIPLSVQSHDLMSLCSCGYGNFPRDFKVALPRRLQGQQSVFKASVRAAVSPMFWAPFTDDVHRPSMPVSEEKTQK